MAYITTDELAARVGGATIYLQLTDDDADGSTDSDVEDWVLDLVGDLVDGSAARGGYVTPLVAADAAYLNSSMLDVANYKLKARRGKPSDADRQQYEDALALFERVASGEFTLPSASGGASGGTTTANLDFTGYPQLCNRDRLRDL